MSGPAVRTGCIGINIGSKWTQSEMLVQKGCDVICICVETGRNAEERGVGHTPSVRCRDGLCAQVQYKTKSITATNGRDWKSQFRIDATSLSISVEKMNAISFSTSAKKSCIVVHAPVVQLRFRFKIEFTIRDYCLRPDLQRERDKMRSYRIETSTTRTGLNPS